MANTLIAYFSRADENYFGGAMRYVKVGNTEIVVNGMKEQVSADTFKIEMKDPYSPVYMTCIEEAKKDLRTNARPELTNYYAGDSVFATDGSVVTQYKIKLFDEPVLISSRLMDIIGSITEENVEIYVQDDSISVLANGIEVFSRIADSASQYAIDKVKGFIDTEFSQWVKVNKNTLLNALDRIAIFVDKYDNQAVRLVFDRSNVVISNIKSGSEELVEIVEKKVDKSKKKFEPYEVYINVQMLTEQLKSYIGEVVTINYGVDFAISLSSESTTQIVSLMEV